MTARHECVVLRTVLAVPPKSHNMIVDGFRRALHDFAAGSGSFFDKWREWDPALAAQLKYCPLCGQAITNGESA